MTALADRLAGRRWSWAALPASIAVASRIYSLAVLAVLGSRPGARPGLPSIWDAAWYERIVAGGYHGGVVHGGHDFAFFPAWPLLLKVASLNGILPIGLVGSALANVVFVAAAVVIWRVFADRLGESAATGGVLLLSFAPAAHVFSLPYSEPLFLLAVGLYFLADPTSRWRLPLAALAMLNRIAGAAVVASALVQAAQTHGRARATALATAAAGCLAFVLWWAFIAVLTQQFAGFLHGSPSWATGSNGLLRLISALRRPTVARLAWILFVAVVTAGALALLRVDRELAVFSLAALAFALLPGGMVNAMPRYALSAFPAFAGVAIVLTRVDRRMVVLVAVGFAVAQIAFAAWVLAAAPRGVAP